MTTLNERAKRRKQKLKEQNIEAQKGKQWLKALPKPLRKLETELGDYVDFMEVYDGYLGDFTGEMVPVTPVKNPFTVMHGMGLNFPHPNTLNDVQNTEYVKNIEKAFSRMVFYFQHFNIFENEDHVRYEQLLFFIENPPKADFGHITTLNTGDFSIILERMILST